VRAAHLSSSRMRFESTKADNFFFNLRLFLCGKTLAGYFAAASA
jgi:hypothetical protein